MRKDVYVQNDSGGMSVLSRSVLERVIDDGRENDGAFVRAHEAILGSLVGDDSFIARVVVSEPLRPEEEREWIAHYRWGLKVPCGKLLVAGGFDPDILGQWLEDGAHEGVQAVEVPPGHYLVDVYTYLHSMNGRVIMEQEWDEKLGRWFRQDHPGRAFPSWVAGELSMFHEEDPGHESEWEDLAASVEEGTLAVETDPLDWVGFLVHLQPFEPGAALTEPEEGDWFGAGQGLRRPDTFPLGVPSREAKDPEYREALRALTGEEDEDEAAEASPGGVKTVDVFSSVGFHVLDPIEGGPVEVSPRDMARLFRLAWFATNSAHPEVYAEGPGVPECAPRFEACKSTAVQTDSTALRVAFEGPGGRFHSARVIAACDPAVWTQLPPGTLLELATYAPDLDRAREAEDAPEVGTLRFRGRTRGEGERAVWEITESYPPVSAATLRDALALSAAAETTRLPLRSPEEARAVLDRFLAQWAPLYPKGPPATVVGSALELPKPDETDMLLLATDAFRLRYADTWPFEALLEEDDDEDEDEDDDD